MTDWLERANCRDDPTDLFFNPATVNRALLICSACLVRTECLEDALNDRTESIGVRGGMTDTQRRRERNRRRIAPAYEIRNRATRSPQPPKDAA